jgi:hypothetical protein
MKNNLFNGVRLVSEKKALNNELKSIQSRATELNRKANINAVGQIQIPLYELRGVISDSGATKINGYEITPSANIITRARMMEGLTANAKYPIFRTNCSRWENEQGQDQTTDSVTLSPHRLFSEISYSVSLIKSTDETLQNALTQDLLNDIFNKVESTLLSDKSATDCNPLGLFAILSPTETTALTINVFASAEKEFYKSGAKQPIFIFSPSAFAKTKETLKELFSNGRFNDVEYVVTNNMEDNYILLADLSYLLVGSFGSLDVQIDDVTEKISGKTRLLLNSFWDWNVTNQGAFQAIKLSA